MKSNISFPDLFTYGATNRRAFRSPFHFFRFKIFNIGRCTEWSFFSLYRTPNLLFVHLSICLNYTFPPFPPRVFLILSTWHSSSLLPLPTFSSGSPRKHAGNAGFWSRWSVNGDLGRGSYFFALFSIFVLRFFTFLEEETDL